MIKTLEELSLTKGEYGGGFSAVDYSEDKPRYIRITDIKEGGELKKDTKSPSGTEKDWKKYKLVEGDILFARSGATVGKTFLYEEKYGDCIYAGYLIRFKPNTKIAYPKYVYYYTRTPKYNAWVLNKQNVVAQPNINAKQYGTELKIPLPPLPTQKKIAAILDAADAYRQKTKALIEKYDELTQSLFLDMFGDPVVNEKGWEKVKLNSCLKKVSKIDKQYTENSIEYIDIASIDNHRNVITETKTYLTQDRPSRAQQILETGDVIFSTVRPNLKNIAINFIDGRIGTSGFFVCRTDSMKLNNLFLFILLLTDSITDYFVGITSGANYPAIKSSDLRSFEVILPPLSLQNQFAERVQKIEAQKAQAQESLEKAEELFNSLLGRAFKGELTI